MYTPADVDWVRQERRQEVQQLAEGRGSIEGRRPPPSTRPIIQPGSWLRRLKMFLFKQKSLQETAKQGQRSRKHTEPSLS
jgi:hypothetical protein